MRSVSSVKRASWSRVKSKSVHAVSTNTEATSLYEPIHAIKSSAFQAHTRTHAHTAGSSDVFDTPVRLLKKETRSLLLHERFVHTSYGISTGISMKSVCESLEAGHSTH
ncbi:uncharacterized protein MYCFIDRAFT_211668 [Pseudocercospora fijiensis CIRAD86]|uniref:Uncharacterized protein n=1 Tax=Pseudocercospora fijiensis (strain CIRAD86) TaxID=383855 RepID=M3A873_PSEFD|nr:uncharacterized protein MYCFIDRAFT_211668 [Pseudocercospora fijiensis CIRAD86]EME80801.1 hypothetical protein MYCFIDRAFT_211668 [Pseudocercospora fijiensis CIRAD86]